MREWRKRFFRLVDDKLYFSTSPSTKHHGFIDLSDCLTVKSADDKINKPHCFEVSTRSKTYYMYANTENEKDEWIGAIGRAIVRNSRKHSSD